MHTVMYVKGSRSRPEGVQGTQDALAAAFIVAIASHTVAVASAARHGRAALVRATWLARGVVASCNDIQQQNGW